MEADILSRSRAQTLDPALIELCRKMTPAERLQAAIGLSETILEFYRAGVESRNRRKAAAEWESRRSR